jgi:hypothetical protein
MTSPIAREVEDRKRGRPARVRLTLADDLRDELVLELELSSRIRFPSPRYQADPVAFFREIIGVEPWSRQVDVIEAIRDHKRVAVRAGHKVSKSHTFAGIALWYFCSFPDARVVMTSTTARQVDSILWRELRMMLARSGRCVACKLADPEGHHIRKPCPHSGMIEEEPGELARTGLKSVDFREIVGFTAREAEAVAGVSGRNLLYLADEASGIPDEIFEAIEGNRAGGAGIAMFSNPTRNEGEFYEAFHSKAHLYKTLTISSAESPNVIEGREIIPGLATREWIDEKTREYGESSAWISIRVKGVHAEKEVGKIFPIHVIDLAEKRWHDASLAGRLVIGLDPAGDSGTGDETAFAARRGLKVLKIEVHIGLSEEAHLVHLLSLITALKVPREKPVVIVDREGAVGSRVYGYLEAHAERTKAFELVGMRSSSKLAVREKRIYDTLRDELAGSLELKFREGLGIPEDVKLEKDLHALTWEPRRDGRIKLVEKKKIKKLLGRSPDRYDALALCAWEPLELEDEEDELPSSVQAARSGMRSTNEDEDDDNERIDPYDAMDPWRPKR